MSQHPISQARRGQLLEIASDWVIRIQGGELSPNELDAWIKWINASPDHRQAFDDAQETWRDMGDLKYIQEPDEPSMAGDTYEAELPVRTWRARQSMRREPSRWAVPLAAAALIILSVGAAVVFRSLPEWVTPQAHYSTVVAQHQTVALPDGSRAELGAASEMDVFYSDAERRIELRAGIAYFSVEHDENRPFVVGANGGSVRAIGTEFSVQRTGESVTVVVVDGLVEVQKAQSTFSGPKDADRRPLRIQLPAGQQVLYSKDGGLRLPSQADLEAAIAWRDGRLVLQEKTLSEVISDINRYSDLPIELASADVGALRVSGYVRTDEIASWLSGLEAVFPVEVDVQDDRIVIAAR